MPGYRILTLNHHESYLGLLAETGHEFDIITRYKGLDLAWSPDRVPCQPNMKLVHFDDTIKERLQRGYYDFVLCHTLKNLVWFFPYWRNRFIFVEHIPLFFYTPLLACKSLAKRELLRVFRWAHRTKVVAVSPFKAQTWALRGCTVIEPTPLPFPPAHRQEAYTRAVVVGNHLAERGQELGWPILAPLLAAGVPIDVIGLNPGIAGSSRYSSFSDFQAALQGYRIYLYLVQMPYGDGYNLGLIEAMSMGMAVVTLANPSSPVTHQHDGLVANNADELRAHLDYLFTHPAEVERLGEQARQTVAQRFAKPLFIEKWQKAFGPI